MRDWLRKLVQVRDTREATARGLAVGFFFGVSVFFGLQIVLAAVVSHLVRGNKMMAVAMTAISNPLTSLPIYAACYFVGLLLVGSGGSLPDLSSLQSLQGLVALGPRFLVTLLVGTTVVGLVGAVVVYLTSHRIVAALGRWQKRRRDNVRPNAVVGGRGGAAASSSSCFRRPLPG
jgi:uncharacterized protein